jgi:hypothetical protein
VASRLHVEYQEGDLIMPGDQLGLGTESAIAAGSSKHRASGPVTEYILS